MVQAVLGDLEQAVFIRGGSIIPILLHDDCVSLIPCMLNDIRLEVYPSESGYAHGSLYLDDGSSFEFSDRDAKSARLGFNYGHDTVTVGIEHGDNY